MRHKKNITSNLQNITSHFTEKKKIITLSFRNITLCSLILTLSSINIINTFLYIPNTFALSHQGNAEIKFTFNPTLSINISPSDLIIDNLTPGTNNDSNVINVSVATNASHGYTLSATVGDSLHNNTNLTHTNGTNTFDSIATNSSLSNLTTDNTWGYSYKLSNNTNWNNYSGLSNETSKTLVNTDNQLAKPIDFKIGAKASNTQPSGTYTNTINFIAISKPIPKTIEDIVYMQTFGELLPTDLQSVKDSMILNQDYILKDSRDEKEYYVTRLEDGNVWMTQNLDLDLSHDRPLTSDDTDLNNTTNTAYQYGYTVSNGIVRWVPAASADTINFAGTDLSDKWQDSKNAPYSASKIDNHDASHDSLGNYYNWTVAIASNNSSYFSFSTYNNTSRNPENSICPKGWRLPTISNQAETDENSTNEFSRLNYIYNNNASNTDIGWVDAPIYLIKSGNILPSGILNNYRYGGGYQSSTVAGASSVYHFWISSQQITNEATGFARAGGYSIRCLAR